jgi:hypothetical protein
MRAVEKLLALADGLPLVVTGGGGYNLRTVARLWSMVQALCAGVELPDVVPAAYAAEYGIPRLHDEAEPAVEDDVRRQAREYMEQQVGRLKALLRGQL